MGSECNCIDLSEEGKLELARSRRATLAVVTPSSASRSATLWRGVQPAQPLEPASSRAVRLTRGPRACG